MKELLYTVLELEEWEKNIDYFPCEFCTVLFSNKNNAICQIRTRSKTTNKLIENDFACQECKEKFENNQIPRCDRCGRLRTKSDTDVTTSKYICRCIKHKENTEEKELPLLPSYSEGMGRFAFYEQQISTLQEELATAEEALEIEREEVAKFQEKSEEWSKRQKQELLNKIKGLEEKIKQLEEENKLLKEQQNGQVAQIEVKETKKWPWFKVKK